MTLCLALYCAVGGAQGFVYSGQVFEQQSYIPCLLPAHFLSLLFLSPLFLIFETESYYIALVGCLECRVAQGSLEIRDLPVFSCPVPPHLAHT